VRNNQIVYIIRQGRQLGFAEELGKRYELSPVRLQAFRLSTWKSEVEKRKTAGEDPDGQSGAQFLTS
jgi:hypothetical protein